MNWKEFWNKKGNDKNAFAQVARVGGGYTHDPALLDKIATHIVQTLELTKEDVLLDVCCGNGLITSRLAKYCKKVVGVDFSERLISEARRLHPEIDFVCADALDLDELLLKGSQAIPPDKFDKVLLYFSFQYFETMDKGVRVIENLVAILKPEGKMLLGDVPERSKFFVYYNSVPRILRLIKQMLLGRNDMGKFWSADEMEMICERLGLKGQRLEQPRHLPYAHYRTDYLLEQGAETEEE